MQPLLPPNPRKYTDQIPPPPHEAAFWKCASNYQRDICATNCALEGMGLLKPGIEMKRPGRSEDVPGPFSDPRLASSAGKSVCPATSGTSANRQRARTGVSSSVPFGTGLNSIYIQCKWEAIRRLSPLYPSIIRCNDKPSDRTPDRPRKSRILADSTHWAVSSGPRSRSPIGRPFRAISGSRFGWVESRSSR